MKLFLKKLWLFARKYWFVLFAFVAALVAAVVYRDKAANAWKVLEVALDSFREENEQMEDLHNKAELKKQKINDTYHTEVHRAELNAKEMGEDLDKKKKARIKELVKDNIEDEEEMRKVLEEQFGLRRIG